MSKQFRTTAPVFSAESEDAVAPFLDAKFWEPRVSVTGKVIRAFETENGRCYVLDLRDGLQLNGALAEQVSIGNLTGFRMAVKFPAAR